MKFYAGQKLQLHTGDTALGERVPVTVEELLDRDRALVSFDRTRDGTMIVPMRMLRPRTG